MLNETVESHCNIDDLITGMSFSRSMKAFLLNCVIFCPLSLRLIDLAARIIFLISVELGLIVGVTSSMIRDFNKSG